MNDAQKHNHKLAAEGFGRIIRLMAQEDFRWFLQECAGKELARLDDLIHSRTAVPARREEALSEWIAVKRVIDWPETFANDCGKTLGHEQRIALDITEPKTKSET